jgi:hypothetical protein
MIPRTTLHKAISDPKLLGSTLRGESWKSWRIPLMAAMGEGLTADEREVFQQLTQRSHEPGKRVDEAVCRGGEARRKIQSHLCPGQLPCNSLQPSELGSWGNGNLRCRQTTGDRDPRLHHGELTNSPMLSQLVTNRTQDTLTLSNHVSIVVRSSDWRRLRGLTLIAVWGDELAFFRDDTDQIPMWKS